MQTIDISTYIHQFSYLGIFFWFLIIEQLTPIPEEVSLISLGYICMHNHLNLFIAGGLSLVGLLTTDNALFYLSKKGRRFTDKLQRNYNGKLLSRFKKEIHTHTTRTLVLCALLPKVRFLSPIIAATSGIDWKRFFIINSLTTCAYVTVYTVSGVLFHQGLSNILSQMQTVQHLVFILTVTIICIWVISKLRKYNSKSGDSSY